MMDKDVLATLGATVTKVAAEYSRKLGDGNFGSIGASMTVEASLAAGADPDVAANGLYEFCKAAVARNLKADAIAARGAPMTVVVVPPTDSASRPTVLQPPAVAPLPPVAQVVQQTAELDIVTLDAPLCAHVREKGESRFKVFGGGWKKYGVPVYPEVLVQYKIVGWEQWAACEAVKGVPGQDNRFQLPGGFQKVEVEVNEAGKPVRVHSFK